MVVVRGPTPDSPPPQRGPVVVGVDGSPASDRATEFAFAAAAARGVPLVAAHTWTDTSMGTVFGLTGVSVDWESLLGEEERALADHLAVWQSRYPQVEVRALVTVERPVRTLLEQSAGAQLLVVGSRGRGGFAGMLLGSTSQAVLHHALCPVAVVRASVPV